MKIRKDGKPSFFNELIMKGEQKMNEDKKMNSEELKNYIKTMPQGTIVSINLNKENNDNAYPKR